MLSCAQRFYKVCSILWFSRPCQLQSVIIWNKWLFCEECLALWPLLVHLTSSGYYCNLFSDNSVPACSNIYYIYIMCLNKLIIKIIIYNQIYSKCEWIGCLIKIGLPSAVMTSHNLGLLSFAPLSYPVVRLLLPGWIPYGLLPHH